MAKCAHLSVSAEAYRINQATGTYVPVAAALCNWAVPLSANSAPRWFSKLTGGGSLINPPVDCFDCPGFKPDPGSLSEVEQLQLDASRLRNRIQASRIDFPEAADDLRRELEQIETQIKQLSKDEDRP